ncbi:MAG: hypothetical protein GX020_09885 [Firmicutes bacterium]|jgi:hypothetical protein|nr:hypothetical protein [Bacillota bacterium]
MNTYSYHAEVNFDSGDSFLEVIRETVLTLKKNQPELNECSLADVGMARGIDGKINVTLYFEKV